MESHVADKSIKLIDVSVLVQKLTIPQFATTLARPNPEIRKSTWTSIWSPTLTVRTITRLQTQNCMAELMSKKFVLLKISN